MEFVKAWFWDHCSLTHILYIYIDTHTHTNHFPKLINSYSMSSCFADYTSIFIYITNHEELNLNFKLDLIQISKWFQANQLTLNNKKSSLVKFAPTKSFLYPPNLSYMGQIFIELNNTKFLDLQLDSHLTWRCM
jgi:hypothetical protein